MSAQDRVRWDEKYRQDIEAPYPAPDPLLFEYTPPLLTAGEHRALDLAAGRGQNGLWLAEQGFVVDLVDVSRVALQQARDEAVRRGLRHINFYPADLEQYDLQAGQYELVCVFRYLQRNLFPRLRQAVRPGGRVIYCTWNRRLLETSPDMNPEYLLEIGELAGHFADWRIIHRDERLNTSSVVAIRP